MNEARPVGWLRRVPFRFIGLLLLAYVLYSVDLHEVWEQLRLIGGEAVLSAVGAYLILLTFRFWRWHILSRLVWPSVSFARSCQSCNASIWIGFVTPGRIGELRRAVDLANDSGRGLSATSTLVLFDLFLELFAYVVVAGAGIVLLVFGADSTFAWVLYGLCLFAGLACVLLARWPIVATRRWLPSLENFTGFAEVLRVLETGLRGAAAIQLALTTVFSTIAYFLMIVSLTAAMQLPLDLLDCLTMVGVVGVSGAIPITYFGFGTREVALLWYFRLLGLNNPAMAIAVSGAFVLAQLIAVAVSITLGQGIGQLGIGRRQNKR